VDLFHELGELTSLQANELAFHIFGVPNSAKSWNAEFFLNFSHNWSTSYSNIQLINPTTVLVQSWLTRPLRYLYGLLDFYKENDTIMDFKGTYQ
jgi:hypothetical protein